MVNRLPALFVPFAAPKCSKLELNNSTKKPDDRFSFTRVFCDLFGKKMPYPLKGMAFKCYVVENLLNYIVNKIFGRIVVPSFEWRPIELFGLSVVLFDQVISV